MIDLGPPPKLWLPPKPAIIRAASLEDIKRHGVTFPFPAVPPKPKVLSFITSAALTTDLTTYTFSGLSFGVAAQDRRIIAGFRSAGGTATAISSATIGGIAASIVAQANGGNCVTGLIIALVPTGTSGDIVVTLNNGAPRAAISGVWRATGLGSNTAFHTITSTASPGSGSLNITPGGFAVGAIGQNAGSSYGWTNLTERTDVANDGEGASYSGADSNGATGGGTLAVSCTYSVADTNRAMVAASW